MQQANEAERSQKISLTDTVRTWAALHDSNAPVSLAVLRERERERECQDRGLTPTQVLASLLMESTSLPRMYPVGPGQSWVSKE